MSATVIFVHGAFVSDSAWWWRPVAELLEPRGIASRTVDLPSCGEAPPLGDLHDDAAAVRQAIEDAGGPVVLVGHSYGGMVITEAGTHPEVRHLVYVSAVVSDGVSVLESGFVPTEPDEAVEVDIRDDGTAGEHPDKFAARVLSELPDDVVAEALKRLTRQSLAPFMQPPEGAAWKDVPSTYVVCERDGDVPADKQREQAQRAGTVVELPTNHFPHLESPELLADVLVGVAEEAGAGVASAR